MTMSEMRRIPKRGDVYRHFKGFVVVVKEIARSTDDPNQMLVIYEEQSKKQVWARTLEEFMSYIDLDKYPNAKELFGKSEQFRFSLIGTDYTRVIQEDD